MTNINIADLIHEKAVEEKSISVSLCTTGYCDPTVFDEDVCFINAIELDEIIEEISVFVKENSQNNEFQFDYEFCKNEAQFKIDGYKDVFIINCNPNLKIDFEDIEKPLYEKLIDLGLKSQYNPFE
jgi:hypothetical protein